MSRPAADTDSVRERREFLSRVEPLIGLPAEALARVAESVVERTVEPGEAILVEGGPPGSELFIVREGTLELVHKGAVVVIVGAGEVLGHPSLLTGLAPEFTTRARQRSLLYAIPRSVALEILSRPEGVRFVARTLRGRLIEAARTMRGLPDVPARPVTAVLRTAPTFCEPDTRIRDAAGLMADKRLSALLVKTREGLGIVTDVDLRDKVVAGGISRDAPVSAVMTMPAKTLRADLLAPEAGIEMMASGVNHMPVLDACGRVLGILSASNLMTLDSRSPFALRRSIFAAASADELVAAARDVPHLVVDLLDAHLDAPALARILTLLVDAMTLRLLELALERHGEPPVAYAWLALGSQARSEMNLLSDQDNGLAYADADDPAVDEYFHRVAKDVNEGLRRCGFVEDKHGVLARRRQWRMSLSEWRAVLVDSLEGRDLERLARATVSFDFRQLAGELEVVGPLTELVREAPRHRRFLKSLGELATQAPSPLGFRHKLSGWVDLKRDALLPVQNLARYYALAMGIIAPTTLDRLFAVRDAGGIEPEDERHLREAYMSMAHLQFRHHAGRIRAGRKLDNIIKPENLSPLERVALQEALREVAAAQKRRPRLAGVSG
jgi:CBS domain-containing protein